MEDNRTLQSTISDRDRRIAALESSLQNEMTLRKNAEAQLASERFVCGEKSHLKGFRNGSQNQSVRASTKANTKGRDEARQMQRWEGSREGFQ